MLKTKIVVMLIGIMMIGSLGISNAFGESYTKTVNESYQECESTIFGPFVMAQYVTSQVSVTLTITEDENGYIPSQFQMTYELPEEISVIKPVHPPRINPDGTITILECVPEYVLQKIELAVGDTNICYDRGINYPESSPSYDPIEEGDTIGGNSAFPSLITTTQDCTYSYYMSEFEKIGLAFTGVYENVETSETEDTFHMLAQFYYN